MPPDAPVEGCSDLGEFVGAQVGVALETLPPSACAEGRPAGAPVDIALLVRAVGNALNGCPAA